MQVGLRLCDRSSIDNGSRRATAPLRTLPQIQRSRRDGAPEEVHGYDDENTALTNY